MSAHRVKRPFAGAASDPSQRQITSFFHKAGPSSSSSFSDHQQHVVRPVLSADTEANLLTVGMRVRKSVPEGYKTGSSYCGFNLFNNDAAAAHHHHHQQHTTTTTRPPPSSYPAAHRELLPFCAIHAVGGLAAQPPPPSTTTMIRHDSLDDVPSLSSSQSSFASTTTSSSATPLNIATPSFPRKRSYDDARDESDTPSLSGCLQVPSGDWMDGQVSPRSLVPVGWENTRVMAVPKRARQSFKEREGGPPAAAVVVVPGEDDKAWAGGLGQENMRMVVDEDFPEADFLDYGALEGDAMEL